MLFSTSHAVDRDPRDAWVNVVENCCGAFATEFSGLPFEGTIETRRLGGMECARIAQTSRAARRTMREIEATRSDVCYAILQLGGRARMSQAGHDTVLSPGDMTLIDSNRPCEFQFDGRVVQLSLHVPRALLDQRLDDWQDGLAHVFRRDSSALLAALMSSAFEQVIEPGAEQEEAVGSALLGLLCSALRERAATSAAPMHQPAGVLRDIQGYLMARLGDPALDPQRLARSHGLSERQLYRVFRGAGTSLRRWIRQTRLDRCAADLRNPALRERSVTEIAFGWGFNDAAHFSRVFRAEFDQAPREYRASALAFQPAGSC